MEAKFLTPKRKLIVTMLMFSTLGLVRHGILFPSGVVVLFRAAIGFLFLAALFAFGVLSFSPETLLKHKKRVILAGVITATDWILLFEAYRYTTVAIATMCYCMSSLIFMLVSPFFFGDKITLRKGLAMGGAIFGMLFVSGVINGELKGALGIALALLGALCYAAVMGIGKSMNEVDGASLALVEFGVATVVLIPFVWFTEDLTLLQIDVRSVVNTLILGIVHTGLAYAMWFNAIQHLPAPTISLLSYIDPVSAVFVSAVLLGEPLSPVTAVGCVIVIASMVYSEVGGRKGQEKAVLLESAAELPLTQKEAIPVSQRETNSITQSDAISFAQPEAISIVQSEAISIQPSGNGTVRASNEWRK